MRPYHAALSFVTIYLITTCALAAQASQEELENRLEETLNGARLVGQFSVTNADGESQPQADDYTVSRISRMEDGRWLFTASMSFGDNDVAIPMPFAVEWAGDTPVITLTDQLIPGLGTFSARVLLYDGFYAGTWHHAGFGGGHMWGRVETGTPPDTP